MKRRDADDWNYIQIDIVTDILRTLYAAVEGVDVLMFVCSISSSNSLSKSISALMILASSNSSSSTSVSKKFGY